MNESFDGKQWYLIPSIVTLLLDACMKDGCLSCTKREDQPDIVHRAYWTEVTPEDAERIENFLNSKCSTDNLLQLTKVLTEYRTKL